MVFQTEAHFRQFIHCKFRENVVRALYIPTVHEDQTTHAVLIVNKYGKVGLYEPRRFSLIQAYLLDLSLWHHPDTTPGHMSKRIVEPQTPLKCQRTHLVVDAVFAPHLTSIYYLTNKGMLQGFDIGEMGTERYGVDLLPGKSFDQLRSRKSPTALKNGGHVETHRIYGLPPFPTRMEYCCPGGGEEPDLSKASRYSQMLLIGCSDGCVTIIRITDTKTLFGYRKVRGILHEITNQELVRKGVVTVYRAHDEPITDLLFLQEHHLIASASKDRKFSLTLKDVRGILDPCIISLPKGVNAVAHSETLQMLAMGSDDGLVRLFNQFVPKKALAELQPHRDPVISVQFIQVPFSPCPILLSFSTDVELRAWDPTTFAPLQTLYISFPIKSTILCKTPEFPCRPLEIYQPACTDASPPGYERATKRTIPSGPSRVDTSSEGFLLVLYCNSFAKVRLERDYSYWPFDFNQLAAEFESISSKYQRRVKLGRQAAAASSSSASASASSHHAPRQRYHQLRQSEIEEVERKLNSYVNELMTLKERVEQVGSEVDPTSLSTRVVRSIYALRQDKDKMTLLREGGAFQVLPTVEMSDPIQFQFKPRPAVTELMRDAGLIQVTCAGDLLTPTALECFSSSNMEEMKRNASVAKLNYAQVQAQSGTYLSNLGGSSSPFGDGQSSARVNFDAAPGSCSADVEGPLEILADDADSDLIDDEEDLERKSSEAHGRLNF